MTGDHIEAQGKQNSVANAADHTKLLDDTSFNRYVGGNNSTAKDDNKLTGINSSAFGRSVYAVGEGLTDRKSVV